MKKVIVRLGNGLGNQLFTYAAAYSFAKINNSKLYVDDESGFYKKRYKYELHNFNISAEIAEVNSKFLGEIGKLKRRILIKFDNYFKNKFFLIESLDKEKLTYYQPAQFNINFKEKIYFEGYFQTEKYYKSREEELIKELTFKKEIVEQHNKYIKQIVNSNSVSLHFRQDKFHIKDGFTDYKQMSLDFTKKNIEHAKKGVEYFDKVLNKPTYFLWSNKYDGLREYFPDNKFTFVDSNLHRDPAYDLYLISLCKNFILSPSTFHYWGAYFSRTKNKICLSPNKNFNVSGYYGFSNNKDIRADWWIEI